MDQGEKKVATEVDKGDAIEQYYGGFRNLLRELEGISRQSMSKNNDEISKFEQRAEQEQSAMEKRLWGLLVLDLTNNRSIDVSQIVNLTFFRWLVDVVEIQHKLISMFAPKIRGYEKLSREMKSYGPILKELRKMIKQKKTGAGTYTDFFENIWKRQKQRGMIV